MKKTAYLSLGSNLGDRAANLRAAFRRVGEMGEVAAVSGFYETEPVAVTAERPSFLNCALALETELMLKPLLSPTLDGEQWIGRRRTQIRSPRTIEINSIIV